MGAFDGKGEGVGISAFGAVWILMRLAAWPKRTNLRASSETCHSVLQPSLCKTSVGVVDCGSDYTGIGSKCLPCMHTDPKLTSQLHRH